jgi:uncharacterized phiE125 gp8 family phage protein
MSGLVLQSTEVVEPVTREECKYWARVDGTYLDPMVDSLMVAARQWIEEYCTLSIGYQTWVQYLDFFPPSLPLDVPWEESWTGLPVAGTDKRTSIILGKPNVATVNAIEYLDEEGDTVVFPETAWSVCLTAARPFIYLNEGQTWPETQRILNAVKIEFTAGLGDAIDNTGLVPEGIKTAIKMLVAAWLDNPTAAVPVAVKQIVQPWNTSRIV